MLIFHEEYRWQNIFQVYLQLSTEHDFSRYFRIYNCKQLEARGGSGQGMRVNITASGGQVTGVSINSGLGGGDFAYNYNTSEVLTIIQSGSTNDATLTITAVTDRGGQKFFDVNNHMWDSINNSYQKETTYTLSADEADLIVSVDGIIQPFSQYTVVSADFNEGSGALINL